ncbi:hypothetical protein [Beduinella massiliensis]|uniref:hypothetical protein n=1 Tax=Beduinella massiliensis TaxID=1852363 RepID=UPI000C85F312
MSNKEDGMIVIEDHGVIVQYDPESNAVKVAEYGADALETLIKALRMLAYRLDMDKPFAL